MTLSEGRVCKNLIKLGKGYVEKALFTSICLRSSSVCVWACSDYFRVELKAQSVLSNRKMRIVFLTRAIYQKDRWPGGWELCWTCIALFVVNLQAFKCNFRSKCKGTLTSHPFQYMGKVVEQIVCIYITLMRKFFGAFLFSIVSQSTEHI